jgi:hypothetical protein
MSNDVHDNRKSNYISASIHTNGSSIEIVNKRMEIAFAIQCNDKFSRDGFLSSRKKDICVYTYAISGRPSWKYNNGVIINAFELQCYVV